MKHPTWRSLEDHALKIDSLLEKHNASPMPPNVKELLVELAQVFHSYSNGMYEERGCKKCGEPFKLDAADLCKGCAEIQNE